VPVLERDQFRAEGDLVHGVEAEVAQRADDGRVVEVDILRLIFTLAATVQPGGAYCPMMASATRIPSAAADMIPPA
jgi:hypothetical protein